MDKAQTFNDGVVTIYGAENKAAPGDKPEEKLLPKALLRYKERTVGINRYYTALQANARVDMLIRCLRVRGISPQDVAVVGGRQYRIALLQIPEGIVPAVMDLTLERVEQDYDLT